MESTKSPSNSVSKSRLLRTHRDTRGNQEPPNEKFFRGLMRKTPSSPTYNELQRAFELTSNQVWAVRLTIWDMIRKSTESDPEEDLPGRLGFHKDQQNTGTRIWQMPVTSKNEFWRTWVEDKLTEDPAFTWFRDPKIEEKVRKELVKRWVKKEILAMKDSEAMQDILTEGKITRVVYGIEPPDTRDRVARKPRKQYAPGTKPVKFSNCRIKLLRVDGVEGSVRISAVCGGTMNGGFADLTMAGLTRETKKVSELGIQEPMFWEEGTTREVRDDETFREVMSDLHGLDPTGKSLVLQVK